MNELDKMAIAARAAEGAPHEVLLVLDPPLGRTGWRRPASSPALPVSLESCSPSSTAPPRRDCVASRHRAELPIQYVGVGGDRRPHSVFPEGIRRRPVSGKVVDDGRWMRRALEHARRGLGRTSPNPVVGASLPMKGSLSVTARTSAPANRDEIRAGRGGAACAAPLCCAPSSRACIQDGPVPAPGGSSPPASGVVAAIEDLSARQWTWVSRAARSRRRGCNRR